ncbi:MAG: hypothetical protein NTY19_26455 [Planctomycetota bacterium]|nr:hypothetical protein [Planctomycetota bacterium]
MSDPTPETVIVRDRDGLRHLKAADDWTTLTLLGALSADPRSFHELARAWLRYQPDVALEDLPWAECLGEPARGPWLLLDLVCLRIVAGEGAELPENPGAFQRDEGPWETGFRVSERRGHVDATPPRDG